MFENIERFANWLDANIVIKKSDFKEKMSLLKNDPMNLDIRNDVLNSMEKIIDKESNYQPLEKNNIFHPQPKPY